MADQHDAVARGDAEHGDEARPASPSDSTPPPSTAPTTPPIRANGQASKHQQRRAAHEPEVGVEDQQDAEQRQHRERPSSRRCDSCAGGVLAEELGVVAGGNGSAAHLLLDVAGDRAEVAPA